MRHLLSVAAVLALSGPAIACINDTELINHEREFRSQYRDSQYRPPESTEASSSRPYVLGGAGALMGLAGLGMVIRLRPQAR